MMVHTAAPQLRMIWGVLCILEQAGEYELCHLMENKEAHKGSECVKITVSG